MKSSAKKVELASVDDLFSTEESRADAQREKVVEIPLSELHPFKGHPFKVSNPAQRMVQSPFRKQSSIAGRSTLQKRSRHRFFNLLFH